MKKISIVLMMLLTISCTNAFGISVNDAEMKDSEFFFNENFATAADAAKIFSFTLDSQKSAEG